MTPTARRGASSVFLAVATVALAVALPSGRQTDARLSRQLLGDAALPGIDRGLAPDTGPIEPVDRMHRAALVTDASGEPRALYARGSVIVKFRDETVTARQSALRMVGGQRLERPTGADFELMTISPAADPEAVATTLSGLAEVEYAQARYRNHAMLTPTDPFYSLQWNFPALDMERAWDINPGASSSVVVAVLDSGVAYRDAIVRYNATPFRLEQNGPVYPALGIVEVPFASRSGPRSRNALRRAARLRLGRRPAARSRWPWHPCRRHHRPGHQQRHRRRRHGVQRAHHAGQGHRRGVGLHLRQPQLRQRRHGRAGHPLRRRQRRPRHQHEHRTRARRRGAGRRSRRALRRVEGRLRGHRRRQRRRAARTGPTAPPTSPPRIDGAVAVARGRSRARPRLLLDERPLRGDLGAGRRLSAWPATCARAASCSRWSTSSWSTRSRWRRRSSAQPRFDVFNYYYLQGTSMATPHVAGFAALLHQQGLTSPAAIEAAMKQFAIDRGATGRDDLYGAGLINPRADAARPRSRALGADDAIPAPGLRPPRRRGARPVAGAAVPWPAGRRPPTQTACRSGRSPPSAPPGSRPRARSRPCSAAARGRTSEAVSTSRTGRRSSRSVPGASRRPVAVSSSPTGGQVFPLGIPTEVTMTPLEVAAGWRFRPLLGRIRPHLGAGYTRLRYEETADVCRRGRRRGRVLQRLPPARAAPKCA